MRRQIAITTLCQTGWLSRQPAAFQQELLRNAELRTYRNGSTIQVAGDEPAGLYGLASGQLSVMITPDASPHILAQVAQPGWWFGDVALLSDGGRVVTVGARGPVEILVIKRASILRLAEQDAQTWKRIAGITLMHLDQALRIIRAVSIPSPELRIALALSRLIERYSREADMPADILVTRSELGEMARMTRNAVIPVLNGLQADGLITCSYRKITVCSVAKLWQFIEAATDLDPSTITIGAGVSH